jgi:signal transduction histidine kinase
MGMRLETSMTRTAQASQAEVGYTTNLAFGRADDSPSMVVGYSELLLKRPEDLSTSEFGLSTVYGKIRRREGQVTIQTAVGEGTTVSVRLPVET